MTRRPRDVVDGEDSDVLLASNLAIAPSLTQISKKPLIILYLGSLKLRDAKKWRWVFPKLS